MDEQSRLVRLHRQESMIELHNRTSNLNYHCSQIMDKRWRPIPTVLGPSLVDINVTLQVQAINNAIKTVSQTYDLSSTIYQSQQYHRIISRKSFAMTYAIFKINPMLSWDRTLIDLTNNHDHELDHTNDKQLEHITIASVARYTIILSSLPKADHSDQNILTSIKEEYGLEQDQLQIQNYEVEANASSGGQDLATVFAKAQAKISGNLEQFKAHWGITAIEGYRKIVNDGNTIIFHFWDSANHYVLLHQIKY